MEGLIMNYIEEEDFPDEDIYNTGFSNFNNNGIGYEKDINDQVEDINYLQIKNEVVQDELNTLDNLDKFQENSTVPNEFLENSQQGTAIAFVKKEVKTEVEDQEILSPNVSRFDPISCIVISKVETVTDNLENSELNSKYFNTAMNNDTKITFICDICGFLTTTRFALARHKAECKSVEIVDVIKSENLKKVGITFNCNICAYSATSRFALERHKSCHDLVEDKKVISFTCDFCTYSATSRFAIARHQEEHKENLKSKKEKTVLYSANNVENINGIIPKIKVFKCEMCKFTSKFRFALKRHYLSHKKSFTCSRCYNLVLVELKNEHLLKCIKKHEHFACDNCPYKTVYTKMFLKHQRLCKKYLAEENIQENEIVQSKKANHKCQVCSFTTKWECALIGHLKAHKSGRPTIKCERCNFKSTPLRLRLHYMNTHSEELSKKAFQCKECSFHTDNVRIFHRHNCVNIHVNDKTENTKNGIKEPNKSNYSCHYCSFTTSFRWALTSHLKAHKLGRPVIKCKICNFKSTPLSLGNHYKDSHGVKPSKNAFKCNKCPFYTNNTNRFHRHICLHNDTNIHENNETANIVEHTKNGIKKLNKSKYICHYCSFTTGFKWALSGHLKAHKSGRPVIECKRCKFKSTPLSLSNHYMNSHGVKPSKKAFQCEKCPYYTNNAVSFHKHNCLDNDTNIHENNETSNIVENTKNEINEPGKSYYNCRYCSFTTCFPFALTNHLKTHKSGRPSIKCKICNFKSTFLPLKKHYLDIHGVNLSKNAFQKHAFLANGASIQKKSDTCRSDEIFRCDQCDFTSFSKSAWQKHVNTHDAQTGRNIKNIDHCINKQTFKCNTCSFSTTSNIDWKTHNTIHEKILRVIIKKSDFVAQEQNSVDEYRCKYCSFICSTSESLKFHLKFHTKMKKTIYNCKICDFKGFKSSISNHMDKKHNIKMKNNIHHCKLCNYSTNALKLFKFHVSQHTLNAPIIQCKYCDFKSTKRIYQMHLRLKHSDTFSIKYLCHLCSYFTKQKFHLKRHLKVHERGVELKACNKCNFKSFAYVLGTHYETVHGLSPYKITDTKANKKINNNKKQFVTDITEVGKKYHCNLCSYASLNKLSIKHHCDKVHIKKESPTVLCAITN